MTDDLTPHHWGAPAPRDFATLADMQDWARWLRRSREPDVVIGTNYMLRWHVIPRNPWHNVYLHEFRRSDDDRALHDHPWDNTTFVIEGEYREHTEFGRVYHRQAGETVSRSAETLHRIELIDGRPAVSLFMTGPKIREWGFACPQGWRHWTEFTTAHGNEVGKGCE